MPLGALEVRARGRVTIAADGAKQRTLEDGDRWSIEPEGRAVRYVAIAGGVDVPEVLGARATLLVAGLGGRGLRKGVVVPASPGEPSATPADAPRFAAELDAPIDLLPGPLVARFPDGALDALVASTFTVSRLSDRVGARLDGPKIARRDADVSADAPAPMIRGAVQITSDGTPIVLGPDHPTTGGYPVLAVVTRAGASRLPRRHPGSAVRFRLV